MSKSVPAALKKGRNKTIRWVVIIFIVTMIVSGMITLVSDEIMSVSGLGVAFGVLLLIIFIGVIFDVIGMAVASADEKPFHSMAARKVPGSLEALMLLKNAERVSSICNDVIGDICGVVAGSASATVAVQILQKFEFSAPQVISLLLSALVAGLTVGGKAIGKFFAIHSCTKIVHNVGKIFYWFRHIPDMFRKKT